jgi:hypothetical protein
VGLCGCGSLGFPIAVSGLMKKWPPVTPKRADTAANAMAVTSAANVTALLVRGCCTSAASVLRLAANAAGVGTATRGLRGACAAAAQPFLKPVLNGGARDAAAAGERGNVQLGSVTPAWGGGGR